MIAEMKDGQSIVVEVEGVRGEASTQVEWKDSAGTHSGMADDYVEGVGGYHVHVALTADKRVQSINFIH